ncbi:MAG: molybdenum ABC transporter ATP-binding protein [Oceanicaulis sp.]|nr:molybdenum ABC transporter ATP-binding protein [Oceanicaulis sp.]
MPDRTLDIDLDHRRGGFSLTGRASLPLSGVTGIVGPNGAGKTSLLRVIAGLDRTRGNTIRFDSETWQYDTAFLPAHRRRAPLVFQDSRLFTHLSVTGNLDYAGRRAAPGGHGPDRAELIDLLQLAPLMARRTADLSGGERQRVALGRALSAGPRLLLLDEAFSALDAGFRQNLLPVLRERLTHWQLPALVVSHSARELAVMADHVLPVENGRVGTLCPRDAWLAGSEGAGDTTGEPGAVLTGRITGHDARLHLTDLHIGEHRIALPGLTGLSVGREARLYVPARDITLALDAVDGLSVRNRLPATVAAITDRPDTAWCDVELEVARQRLCARITRAAAEALSLKPGDTVIALIKSASLAPRQD